MNALATMIDTPFLLFFAKSLLVLVAAVLVLPRLKFISAAQRHLLWVLTMGLLVLLPFASSLTLVEVPAILPSWLPSASSELLAEDPTAAAASEQPMATATTPPPGAAHDTEQSTVPGAGALNPTQSEASETSAISGTESFAFSRPSANQFAAFFLVLMGLVWLTGMLVSLARTLVAYWRVEQIRSVAPHAVGNLPNQVAEACKLVGIGVPAIHITPRGSVPVSGGIFRPALLLPADISEWSTERQTSVLVHELTHIKRRDALSLFCARLALALHWYNPLMKLAYRHMMLDQEKACDDAVLSQGNSAHSYAHDLVDLAQSSRKFWPSPVLTAMSPPPSHLEERLRSLLNSNNKRRTPGLAQRTLLTLATGAFLIGMAGIKVTVADGGTRSISMSGSFSEGESYGVSVEDNGKEQVYKIHRGKDFIELKSQGKITFDASETRVTAISSGGEFELKTQIAGVEERVRLRPHKKGFKREYWVDGRSQDFDQDAEAFLAETLPDLFKNAGIRYEQRTDRWVKEHGIDGTLDQIATVSFDGIRSKYVTYLVKNHVKDPAKRLEIMTDALREADGDYHKAEIIKSILNDNPTSQTIREIGELLPSLESDYYKGEMLDLLLRNPEHLSLDLVMGTAKTLESDYELAETLTKVSRENNLTGNQLEDFLKLADQLDSDYDFGRVMESLLKHQDTTPSLARRIIAAGEENLDSDYELAQLLLRVNKQIRIRDDARLEELYLHAAQSLGSEWERGRVLDAAFGKGRMR